MSGRSNGGQQEAYHQQVVEEGRHEGGYGPGDLVKNLQLSLMKERGAAELALALAAQLYAYGEENWIAITTLVAGILIAVKILAPDTMKRLSDGLLAFLGFLWTPLFWALDVVMPLFIRISNRIQDNWNQRQGYFYRVTPERPPAPDSRAGSSC
jgi:hypothetical protein